MRLCITLPLHFAHLPYFAHSRFRCEPENSRMNQTMTVVLSIDISIARASRRHFPKQKRFQIHNIHILMQKVYNTNELAVYAGINL